jgi:phosphatidylserine/phosphatidylglycerophosphate/cardiolipin synthase-like enzyme
VACQTIARAALIAALISQVVLVAPERLASAAPAERAGGRPTNPNALRAILQRGQPLAGKYVLLAKTALTRLAGKSRTRYRRFLLTLQRSDPDLARALKACGASCGHLTAATDLEQHGAVAKRVVASIRVAEFAALRQVLGEHYQSKNQRWGFLGVGGRVRRGRARAREQANQFHERSTKRNNMPPSALPELRRLLHSRIDQMFAQTRGKRFPDRVPLEAGGQAWWTWLGRFGQVLSRDHSDMQLLIDGPKWRAATLEMVATAKDYLHIASWAWHYDDAGQLLMRAVVARKLGLSPETVEQQLRAGKTVATIRDEQLTARLAAKHGWTRDVAGNYVRGLAEAEKRKLVNADLDPLEVRVLLGALVQGFDRLRAGLGSVIPDLERVGVEVIQDNRLFQRRFPYVQPQHLWAAVPHAKLMMTRGHALTGGLNIGNHYMQPEGEQLVWHDAALSVKGGVTRDLNSSFINHWNRAVKSRGIVAEPVDEERRQADGTAYYYPQPDKQDATAHAMVIGTDALTQSKNTRYSHRTALMLALASAQREFQMVVPYFNSPLVVKQLIRMARRFKQEGKDPAKIRIVITGHTDTPLYGDFFTNHFAYLLQREGITVEAWNPDRPHQPYAQRAMHHAKIWMVDNRVAYLGSANASVRSLVQDWEVGVLTDDKAFVRKVREDVFDADRKYCRPIKIRPAWQRYIGYSINLLMGPVLRFL